MPAPTVASPNVGNYQVGKGVVSFKKEGDSVYRDLGNVSELTLSPDLTTLEHFSSRGGTKTKDLVIVLEKKSTLKIVMDEITADNLALMLLGDVDTSAVGGPEIDIYASTAISGALKFVGANEIGAQVTMDLYNVTFTPSGDVGFISDEFNNLEATADVLVKTGIAPVYAEGVYTLSGSLVDADTVTIGGKVYTLQASLTNVNGHVKIGATDADTLANLAAAINLDGVAGTDYAAATTKSTTVEAESDATHLYVTALSAVAATGNAVTTTDTSTGAAWGGATLAGGVDGDVQAGKFGLIKLTNVEPV
jgi:hypothetical protein